MLGAPPTAALEAVELCGRLPLALGIAGGIIEELGSTWQHELVPLLRDEFGGEAESVEERVVTASLRVVPKAMRAGVESLFALFAIFAEDVSSFRDTECLPSAFSLPCLFLSGPSLHLTSL